MHAKFLHTYKDHNSIFKLLFTEMEKYLSKRGSKCGVVCFLPNGSLMVWLLFGTVAS